MKQCSRCKVHLPTDQFGRHKTRGLQAYCRLCKAAYKREGPLQPMPEEVHQTMLDFLAELEQCKAGLDKIHQHDLALGVGITTYRLRQHLGLLDDEPTPPTAALPAGRLSGST